MRGSLYVLYAAVPLAVGGAAGTEIGNLALIAGALAVAQAATSVFLLHRAIDFRLGKGPRPARLIAVAALLSVATVAAGWPAYEQPDETYPLVVTVVLTAFVTALAPLVSTPVTLAIAAGGWLVATGPAILRDARQVVPLLMLFLMVAGFVATSRSTVWMLDIIWQLDDAQQVKADLAVAEERLRFARDLHDVAGRALSVVALKAELAAKLAARGRPEAADEMHEVRRIAQESLADLRTVVTGLRTAKLDEELAGARSLLTAAGITCRVIGAAGGLGPRTQTALGWAVREATTNVLRHSEARECTIELDRDADGAVSLTMTNDGTGGGKAARHGNGLTGLTERIAAVGGAVTAGPLPPDQFQVQVRLPKAPEENA
jgi:two-component system sensor histidine kinase DesK